MHKQNTGIHSVYIGNLSYNRDEDNILGLVKSYGFIKNIKILREGKANKSKGIAFVDMVNLEDATKLISAMNGKLVDGRTLKASLANVQNFVGTSEVREAQAEEEDNDQPTRKEVINRRKKQKRLGKKEGLQALFASKH